MSMDLRPSMTVRSPRQCDAAWCSSLVTWLLIAVWILNAADLALTADALAAGRAQEANALMAVLFGWGLLPAAAYKIGVATVGVFALYALRRYRAVLVASAALAVSLVAVVVYQLVFLWAHTF
jgi:hypothetical protein